MGNVKSVLSLADFKAAFGDLALALPDGQVLGSSQSDWPAVVQAIGRTGWSVAWSHDGGAVELGQLHDPDRRLDSFAVRPIPTVRVNFFLGDEVLFDVDLRELQDQVALDAVCEVFALLGRSLGKPVTLSHEGDFDDVVIRYEPGTDDFTLIPTSIL
ncbi:MULTISPECIES: hypothetical protein [unclassified Leifsonia]|uniref:hypothetical protein n=1 Tax=unclassified Leifsonia TaxID=2663824 RepID=UPI0006F3CC54|nr:MULTISPECIES: hypothetical protein [unclassified Leifsonia]KQX07704.1 hypothetical protein ASC59_08210 [Leifsonia sp. Root1293]KRA11986.1 hypothetical protein ASD61_08210 [Leifsonia sp. Root60]